MISHLNIDSVLDRQSRAAFENDIPRDGRLPERSRPLDRNRLVLNAAELVVHDVDGDTAKIDAVVRPVLEQATFDT